jgi:hypothetical protein
MYIVYIDHIYTNLKMCLRPAAGCIVAWRGHKQQISDCGISEVYKYANARTARVIGGLDSSDIFCNSDYKHFLA